MQSLRPSNAKVQIAENIRIFLVNFEAYILTVVFTSIRSSEKPEQDFKAAFAKKVG